MRKWVSVLVCVMSAGMLQALPLSKEAQEEARFFNAFLEAVYAQRNGDKGAMAKLRHLQAQRPESVYLKQLIVRSAVDSGDLETAKAYIDFITPEEKDPETWLVYGDYLNKNAQWSDALGAFEKAMELDPDDPKFLAGYVEALLHVGTRGQIIEKLQDLIPRYPALEADVNTQIGYIYLSAKDWKNALAYFDKALGKNPELVQAHLGKIKAYAENNLFLFIFNEFTELEKIGYHDPQIYRQMALWYMATENKQQAETYFLKAWALEQGDPLTAVYLADFAFRRNDYQAAFDYLTRSTDYEKDPNKWMDSAVFLDKMGKRAQSHALLKKGYEKFPDNIKMGYFYALSLQNEKKYQQAAAILKHLLEVGDPYTDVRLSYAFVLENLKQYDEMENQVKLLLAAAPDHAPALNLLAYSLAERAIRLDEAEQLALRAVGVSPQDMSFIDTLAWVYARAGKWDQAQLAISAIPEEVVLRTPEMAYHKGFICFYQQNQKCAAQYLERAQKEHPAAKKLYKQLKKQER